MANSKRGAYVINMLLNWLFKGVLSKPTHLDALYNKAPSARQPATVVEQQKDGNAQSTA